MKNKLKRMMALLLTAAMLGSLLSVNVFAVDAEGGEAPAKKWEVSKSKTAEALVKDDNGNYTSKVTLSLPSAEEELVSDVVFVLDNSSCNKDVFEQAAQLLEELDEYLQSSDATVKVGIVGFRGYAKTIAELDSVEAAIEKFKDPAAMKNEIRSWGEGTNMDAGLEVAAEMLAADTAVSASRKYVVLVSDGLTRQFNVNGVSRTIYNTVAKDVPGQIIQEVKGSPAAWCCAYGFADGSYQVPGGDWNTYFENVKTGVQADGDKYAVPAQVNGTWIADLTPATFAESFGEAAEFIELIDGTANKEGDYHAFCLDRAIYEAYQEYSAMCDLGYHCYAKSVGNYPLGLAFMGALNEVSDSAGIDFSQIQKDIMYLLAKGSYVVDYMGYTADYNFDFVNDASALSMVVGEEALEVVEIEENHYGFGKNGDGTYQYELIYTFDKADGEYFKWKINVPVSNFAPVQLTYQVWLEPSEEAGVYGVYDEDGSRGEKGLYTNNSATLYPMDSNGDPGKSEDFLKPTVSYTVEAKPPVRPPVTPPVRPPVTPPGGGTVIPDEDPPIADLNKEDHFAYVVGYPVDYITGEKTDDQTRMPVRPEGNITRAEVSTIFFRLLTDESRNEIWSQTNDYSDVAAGQWFNAAISTLSNGEIITGYPSGDFKPNGKITRAEFATIAVRFFGGHYEGQDKFSDINGHWAQDNINLAAALDLINGYPDGTFAPDQFITRAEAMTLVNRVLDRHPDAEHMLDNMLVWPDNMDTSKWYYEAVQEATNSHKYEMLTDKEDEKNTMENWIELLPVRDWPAFEKAWADANAAINPGEVMH